MNFKVWDFAIVVSCVAGLLPGFTFTRRSVWHGLKWWGFEIKPWGRCFEVSWPNTQMKAFLYAWMVVGVVAITIEGWYGVL